MSVTDVRHGRAVVAPAAWLAVIWPVLCAVSGWSGPGDPGPAGLGGGEAGDHARAGDAGLPLRGIELVRLDPPGRPTGAEPTPRDAVVTLPTDLAAALTELDWVRGCVKWNALCDAEPRGRAISPAGAALEDSTRVVAALYSEALAPPPPAWRGYEIGGEGSESETDWHPLLRARIDAEMRGLSAGAPVRVAGTVFRGQNQAGLLLHIEGAPKDTPDGVPFAARFAASVLRWPPGTGGAGTVACREIAGGTEWTHGVRVTCNRSAMDLRSAEFWPWTVQCWSDGEWLLIYALPAIGYPGPLRPRATEPPPILDERAPRYASASAYLERSEESFRAPCPAVGVTELTPELFVAWLNRNQPEGDLVSIVNGAEAGVAKYGLRLRAKDEWASGETAPVPAEVRAFLNVPEGTLCWQARFANDGFFGSGVAGLLDVPRRPVNGGEPRLVQWVLGERHLTITVASRPDAAILGRHFGHSASRGPMARAPADIAAFLGPYCGEYGWRLAFAPVKYEHPKGLGGFLITPVADAPYGFLGEQRVGDQPWARCVIYGDSLVFHILFDLPKKEAGE